MVNGYFNASKILYKMLHEIVSHRKDLEATVS